MPKMSNEEILELFRKLAEVNKKIAENEAKLARIQSELEFWQIVVDEFYEVEDEGQSE